VKVCSGAELINDDLTPRWLETHLRGVPVAYVKCANCMSRISGVVRNTCHARRLRFIQFALQLALMLGERSDREMV
jgi:hypothetical protein